MAKLSDLDLDRVDGVDEPATRRRFLLLKAEEPDELRENVRALLEKVEHALYLLAKSADLAFDDETAEALNAVAKALDVDVTFKAKRPKEEYGYPPPPPPRVKKAEEESDGSERPDVIQVVKEVTAQIEQRLAEIEDVLKSLIDRLAPPQASAVEKRESRQLRAQDSFAPKPDPWRAIFFGG